MNTKDLIRLGVPPGEATRRGMEFIARYILKGLDKTGLVADVQAIIRNPAAFVEDELSGEFAKALSRVVGDPGPPGCAPCNITATYPCESNHTGIFTATTILARSGGCRTY